MPLRAPVGQRRAKLQGKAGWVLWSEPCRPARGEANAATNRRQLARAQPASPDAFIQVCRDHAHARGAIPRVHLQQERAAGQAGGREWIIRAGSFCLLDQHQGQAGWVHHWQHLQANDRYRRDHADRTARHKQGAMTNPTTPCSPVTVCIDEVCPLHSVLAGHDRRQHRVGVANLQAAAGGQFLHVKVCG